MSKIYTATAVPWSGGWELHIEGVGVTQVRVLAKAEQQVRDLVETMTGVDAAGAEVRLRFDLQGVQDEIADAQSRMEAARGAEAQAAEDMRRIVAGLRRDGISVSDVATVLGVSRGRVSQLASG